jgi:molybdopterin/thiamine biosynthesis adenylyltransferase
MSLGGGDESRRYSRQLIIPGFGAQAQSKLAGARVLVVGTGGLGSPALLYLAAAGVGTLGLVDGDTVDVSNLQRQILHSTFDVGRLKVDSAAEKLVRLNPHVRLEPHAVALDPGNALELVRRYDVAVGAVDNFPARYLLHDACYLAGRPLVEAGVLRFEGLLTTVIPGKSSCYRCVFPSPPPEGALPSAREAGVIGPVPGVIGALQALEVIKLVTGLGDTLSGRLLIYDGLAATFREVSVPRNPHCPLCGEYPKIKDLLGHRADRPGPTGAGA